MPVRFRLQLKKPRRTKLGDFRPPRRGQLPHITVNVDLPPHAFLVTLTHEIAHLLTWNQFGSRVQPHGPEWRHCFAQLLEQLAHLECLSDPFRRGLAQHAQRPMSSTHRDPEFYRLLRILDGMTGTLLDELPVGAHFHFGGRHFIKTKTRRTRCLCHAPAEGVDYQISRLAEVDPIESSNTHLPTPVDRTRS